jgi:hypothetical protein
VKQDTCSLNLLAVFFQLMQAGGDNQAGDCLHTIAGKHSQSSIKQCINQFAKPVERRLGSSWPTWPGCNPRSEVKLIDI